MEDVRDGVLASREMKITILSIKLSSVYLSNLFCLFHFFLSVAFKMGELDTSSYPKQKGCQHAILYVPTHMRGS